MQDGNRILEMMGRTYPERASLDELCSRTGFGTGRTRRAVVALLDWGLVDVRPPSGSCLPHLTEAGMAVAFGLAPAATAGVTLAALEKATVRALIEQRTRRFDGLDRRSRAAVDDEFEQATR